MSWYRLTMADIEAFYKGLGQHPFFSIEDLYEFAKATGTITSSLTGYRNPVYGALLWRQLNTEANIFGALPKTNWPRSGWRVKTDWATSSSTDIAIAETGTLPSAVYPPIATVKASPKVQVINFEISEVMEALAEVSQDDIWGAVDQVRADMGVEFIKRINQQLIARAIGTDDVTSTTPGDELTSLDRIVSNTDEASAFTVTASKINVYDIDKSAATWANPIVKYSTTGQDLTDDLIRQTLAEARKRGANTNLIITGYDTYAKIQGLYMNFIRYVPLAETRVKFGVNGIETATGMDVGINVSALYGIPVIQAVDTPSEGSGFVSRIYMLDTTDTEGYGVPRLGISVLRPVEYFETRDYALLQKFAVRGVYRFAGEVTARYMYGQAKIRDLRA